MKPPPHKTPPRITDRFRISEFIAQNPETIQRAYGVAVTKKKDNRQQTVIPEAHIVRKTVDKLLEKL